MKLNHLATLSRANFFIEPLMTLNANESTAFFSMDGAAYDLLPLKRAYKNRRQTK
jgi:hypothetical protein